jgi:hypothetical protein
MATPARARPASAGAFTPPVIAALVAGGLVIAAASALLAIRLAGHAPAAGSGAGLDGGDGHAGAPAASDGVGIGAATGNGADASRPAAALTPLVADSVDTSNAVVPSAEPLAPLEPAPDSHPRPHVKKKK